MAPSHRSAALPRPLRPAAGTFCVFVCLHPNLLRHPSAPFPCFPVQPGRGSVTRHARASFSLTVTVVALGLPVLGLESAWPIPSRSEALKFEQKAGSCSVWTLGAFGFEPEPDLESYF